MTKSRKQQYLEKKPNAGVQLRAEELPDIANFYEEKYGIKIIINGETTFGEEIIRERAARYNQLLNYFDDDSLKYAAYLAAFWESGDKYLRVSSYPGTPFWEMFALVKDKVGIFLDENKEFKKKLTHENMQALSEILNTLPQFKEIVDKNISVAKKELKFRSDNEGLTQSEAMDEIKHIQASLDNDEIVGFFYTNGERKAGAHFDALIISKNKIIRPADWRLGPDKEIYKYMLKVRSMFANASIPNGAVDGKITWMSPNYSGLVSRAVPVAQTSTIECGTLGMVYLKELLKDKGKQLDEFTLSIPYYKNEYGINELNYLFIPSPHVLRYSQASTFNLIIEAMLQDSLDSVVVHNKKKLMHKQFTVTPIRAILEKTIKEAKSENNERVVAECNALLKKLPEFRKKWNEEFHKANTKRESMQGDEYNQYLSYKSTRLQEKVGAKTNKQRTYAVKIKEQKPAPAPTPVIAEPVNNTAELLKLIKARESGSTINTPEENNVLDKFMDENKSDLSYYFERLLESLQPEERIILIEMFRRERLINILNKYHFEAALKNLPASGQCGLISLLGRDYLRKTIKHDFILTDVLCLLHPESRSVLLDAFGKNEVVKLFSYPQALLEEIKKLEAANKADAVVDLLHTIGGESLLLIQQQKRGVDEPVNYHRFKPWEGLYTLPIWTQYFSDLEKMLQDVYHNVLIISNNDSADNKTISISYDSSNGWTVVNPNLPHPFAITSKDTSQVAANIFSIFTDGTAVKLLTEFCVHPLFIEHRFYEVPEKQQDMANKQSLNVFSILSSGELQAVKPILMQKAFNENNKNLCLMLINKGVDFYACNIDKIPAADVNVSLFNELCEAQAQFNIEKHKVKIFTTDWKIIVGGEIISDSAYPKPVKVPKTVKLEWEQMKAAESGGTSYYAAWEKIMDLHKIAVSQNSSTFFRREPAKEYYKSVAAESAILPLRKFVG